MKVTVNYYGQLTAAARVRSTTVELDSGSGIRQCLETCARRHGDEFRQIVLSADGAPRPSLLVTVNGAVVDKGDTKSLAENDAVGLLPAIAGG